MFLDDWEQLDRVDIRPATPSDVPAIARIHVDSWRSVYKEILPKKVLKDLKYSDRERQWMRLIAGGDSGPFVYVADHPRDRVVGFMAGNTEPSGNAKYPGEVYVVFVDQQHSQSDIAARMMKLAARLMIDNGISGMLAWDIAESPPAEFYRSLGGEEVATRTRTYGDAEVREIAFGWANLETFPPDHSEPETESEPEDVEQDAETNEQKPDSEAGS